MRLRSWDFDESTRWLQPVDLFLAWQLHPTPRSVLEIGVHHGGWILQLLEHTGSTGVGVDPYPGRDSVRSALLARARRKGVRFTLVGEPAGALPGPFDIAHIDGVHDEQHTLADLDDYRHPYYPGVAAALHRFRESHDFAVFLVTENKAYLCRRRDHTWWHGRAREVASNSGMVFSDYIGQRGRTPPDYRELPDIAGLPIILCLSPVNNLRVLRGLSVPWSARRERLRDIWLPPVKETLRPAKLRIVDLRDRAARARSAGTSESDRAGRGRSQAHALLRRVR